MKPVLPFGVLAVFALGGTGQAQTAPVSPAPVSPAPAPSAPAAQPQRPLYSAASYIVLGNAYYGKGQYDSAYVAFRAATESDPRSPDALLGLGRSQTRLRLYGPAIETLQRLLGFDSRNLSGYVALAQAYVAQYIGTSDRTSVAGNLDSALRALSDGAVVDPASAVLFNERSIVYKLKGDYKSAIETSKKAAELNPDDSVILYNLGDLYYASGNLPLALATMQKAVISDPTDAQSRAYYGRLLLQMGRPDDAKLELAQAERIAPDNAYVVGQYGVYGYLTRGRRPRAHQADAGAQARSAALSGVFTFTWAVWSSTPARFSRRAPTSPRRRPSPRATPTTFTGWAAPRRRAATSWPPATPTPRPSPSTPASKRPRTPSVV